MARDRLSQSSGMELELVSCGLQSLLDMPPNEGELRGAVAINLHGNHLSSLYGLTSLPNLLELNLSSNSFTTCDLPELVYLTSLRVLDLSGNMISTLEDLPFLTGVNTFLVSFNVLRNLDGISNFPNLEVLDCRGNGISSAADCMHLQTLGSLKELWLSSADGRNANPICSKVHQVIELFDEARYFGEIDGKDRHRWALDAAPLLSYTPRFDQVAHRFFTSHKDQSDVKSLAREAPSLTSFRQEESVETEAERDETLPARDDADATQLLVKRFSRVLRNFLNFRLLRYFSIWRGNVSYLNGLITERDRLTSISLKQAAALEELVADERQKNAVLEELALKLREGGDLVAENLLGELEKQKRLTEDERDRSEQLRVQLLKHVAISNTQNAELQRSRAAQAELLEENRRYHASLKDAEASLSELQTQLHDDRAAAESSAAASQGREQSLRDELLRVRADYEGCVDRLRFQISHATSSLEEEKLAKETLATKCAELETEREMLARELEAERLSHQKHLNELQSAGIEKDAKKMKLDNLKSILRQLQDENEQLRSDLSTSSSVAEQQRVSIAELCGIVQELKGTLKKTHSRCKHAESQRDQQRAAADCLAAQVESAAIKFESQQRSLKEQSDSAMRSMQMELKRFVTENDKLVSEIAKLRLDFKTLSDKYRSKTEKDDRSVSEAVARAADLEHVLRVKERVIEDQAGAISSLKAQLESIGSDAHRAYEEAQNEIYDLKKQLATSLKMEKKLRDLIENLQDREGGSSGDESDVSLEKVPPTRPPENDIRDEIKSLHESLSLKNKHLQSAQEELRELSLALSHVKTKMDGLKLECSRLREQRDEALNKMDVLMSKYLENEARLSEAESSLCALQRQFERETSAASAERVSLQIALSNKSDQLAAATENLQKYKDAFSAFSEIQQAKQLLS